MFFIWLKMNILRGATGQKPGKSGVFSVRPQGGRELGLKRSPPCSFNLLATAFPQREVWAFACGLEGVWPLDVRLHGDAKAIMSNEKPPEHS